VSKLAASPCPQGHRGQRWFRRAAPVGGGACLGVV